MNLYKLTTKPEELIGYDKPYRVHKKPDNILWYKNGELNSYNDQPAVITHDYIQKWYKDGELHRDNGPAMITQAGTKSWWKNGKRHRDNGPAIVTNGGTEIWYNNGKKHREDGPAVIYPDGEVEWWLNGKEETNSKVYKFITGIDPIKYKPKQ